MAISKLGLSLVIICWLAITTSWADSAVDSLVDQFSREDARFRGRNRQTIDNSKDINLDLGKQSQKEENGQSKKNLQGPSHDVQLRDLGARQRIVKQQHDERRERIDTRENTNSRRHQRETVSKGLDMRQRSMERRERVSRNVQLGQSNQQRRLTPLVTRARSAEDRRRLSGRRLLSTDASGTERLVNVRRERFVENEKRFSRSAEMGNIRRTQESGDTQIRVDRRQHKREEVRAERSHIRERREEVSAERRQSQDRRDEVRAERRQSQEQREEVRGERRQSQDRRKEVRAERRQSQDRREEVRGERRQSQDRREEVRAERRQSQDRREEVRAERRQSQDRREEARGERRQSQDRREEVRAERRQSQDRREEVRAERGQSRERREEVRAERRQSQDRREEVRAERGQSLERREEVSADRRQQNQEIVRPERRQREVRVEVRSNRRERDEREAVRSERRQSQERREEVLSKTHVEPPQENSRAERREARRDVRESQMWRDDSRHQRRTISSARNVARAAENGRLPNKITELVPTNEIPSNGMYYKKYINSDNLLPRIQQGSSMWNLFGKGVLTGIMGLALYAIKPTKTVY